MNANGTTQGFTNIQILSVLGAAERIGTLLQLRDSACDAYTPTVGQNALTAADYYVEGISERLAAPASKVDVPAFRKELFGKVGGRVDQEIFVLECAYPSTMRLRSLGFDAAMISELCGASGVELFGAERAEGIQLFFGMMHPLFASIRRKLRLYSEGEKKADGKKIAPIVSYRVGADEIMLGRVKGQFQHGEALAFHPRFILGGMTLADVEHFAPVLDEFGLKDKMRAIVKDRDAFMAEAGLSMLGHEMHLERIPLGQVSSERFEEIIDKLKERGW